MNARPTLAVLMDPLETIKPAKDSTIAMLKADQTPRHYNPDARPVQRLLEGLRDRPPRSRIVIDKPGFHLELRSSATVSRPESSQ